jgi:hypothetical protein
VNIFPSVCANSKDFYNAAYVSVERGVKNGLVELGKLSLQKPEPTTYYTPKPPVVTESRSFDPIPYEPKKSQFIPAEPLLAQTKQTEQKTGLAVNNLSNNEKTIEVNGTPYAVQGKSKKLFITTPGQISYKIVGFDDKAKVLTLSLGQMYDVTIQATTQPDLSRIVPTIPMPKKVVPQQQQPVYYYYYYPYQPYYYIGGCR